MLISSICHRKFYYHRKILEGNKRDFLRASHIIIIIFFLAHNFEAQDISAG